MIRLTEIRLPLDHPESAIMDAICARLSISAQKIQDFIIFRRGYDARKRNHIMLIYTLDVTIGKEVGDELDEEAVLAAGLLVDQKNIKRTPSTNYQFIAQAPSGLKERPIVIGTGPCGILAALLLAQMGFKPIIVERGKAVRERTKDTFALWRERKLNTESNVQFGEGGAGTFSDGKLHSQIKDKNNYGRKVLTEFVKAGAPDEILYLSKPHIGTFKLVGMVEKIREEIEFLGGEFHFSSQVKQLILDGRQVKGVTLADGTELKSEYVVLAIGHSARDTFEALLEQDVCLEAKPFSVGFRIEHPQSMIDQAQFGKSAGHPMLGSADYKLVHHCKSGRSVYSFCMCPGGTVVAATSEENRVVANGMSQYSRNERNANSGIVVGVTPDDFPDAKENPLAGLDFQRELESRAFDMGGKNYNAPGQLVGDFLANKASTKLGDVTPSYTPGVTLTNLQDALPDFAIDALREAIPVFDRKIKGYARADAMLTGVETRTSSPICVKRDKTFQSINTQGLYPAGEGAGYAGGILSAAVDGIRIAEAVAKKMLDS